MLGVGLRLNGGNSYRESMAAMESGLCGAGLRGNRWSLGEMCGTKIYWVGHENIMDGV